MFLEAGDGLEIGPDDSGAGRPAAAALADFEHEVVGALVQVDRRGVLIDNFAAIDVVAVNDFAV